MKSKSEIITGVIESKEGTISFLVDDFNFKFMDTKLDYSVHTLRPKDRYILGETHDKHRIAIGAGFDIPIRGVTNYNALCYIVSDNNVHSGNIDEFNSISFIGGTINSLLINEVIEEDLTELEKDGKISIRIIDDTKNFQFEFGKLICDAKLYSNVKFKYGLAGLLIDDVEASLTITFPKKFKIKDILFHIGKVKTLISIMTYRKNVGFDRIKINAGTDESATVFLRNDYELTTKHYSGNIRFSDFGDRLSSFFKTVYNSNEDELLYDFGFIPFDDNEARIINFDMIRSIGCALDCEYGLMEFPKVRDKRMVALKKEVKKVIKAHKNSDDPLDDKTYENILTSLGYWSLSFSDKIWKMVCKFKEETSIILGYDISNYREEINSFVKFRNDITHGRIRRIDSKTVETSNVLAGLIYCCFLYRVGLDRETIKRLCKDHLLK